MAFQSAKLYHCRNWMNELIVLFKERFDYGKRLIKSHSAVFVKRKNSFRKTRGRILDKPYTFGKVLKEAFSPRFCVFDNGIFTVCL